MIKAEVEFERERAGREGSESKEHFIVIKSGSQLSERTIPKNGCQGPAKPKEVAHLDIDYRSNKDSQSSRAILAKILHYLLFGEPSCLPP